jgi:hypothetical protein
MSFLLRTAFGVLLAFQLNAPCRASEEPRYLGNDDCRSCHDRGTGALQFGNHIPAYYIWSQEEFADRVDSHHRAFLDLIPDERENPSQGRLSRHIAKLMGLPVERKEGQTWNEAVRSWTKCARCHWVEIPPERIAPPQNSGRAYDPVEDNVGCEACHGPGEKYRDKHYVLYEGETREHRRNRNLLDGMSDLKDLAARARKCLECHSGLDHEIVAAGHPDLNFELYDQSLRQPPHWNYREASPVVFWAVGQAASVEKCLTDLGADSGLYMPIAAFESSSCYVCHHKLSQDRWRQVEGYYPIYKTLLASLGMEKEGKSLDSKITELSKTLRSGDPAMRERIQPLSKEAEGIVANQVAQVSREIVARQSDSQFVRGLCLDLIRPVEVKKRKLAPEIPSAWVIQNFNLAQQTYWAIQVLAADYPAWVAGSGQRAAAPQGIDTALDELWRAGVGYHSLSKRRERFDPVRFNDTLGQVKRAVGGR